MTSRLLLLAELEVLAASDDELLLGLALLALEAEGDLLRRLSLLNIMNVHNMQRAARSHTHRQTKKHQSHHITAHGSYL